MSWPRITLFRDRSSPQSDQPRSASADAGHNPAAGHFQLRRRSGQTPPLEWQFGSEEEARFQLQSSANAPTEGLIVERSNAARPHRAPTRNATTRPPDFDQWRRPTNAATEEASSSSFSRAVEGEIVDSSPDPTLSTAGTAAYQNGQGPLSRSALVNTLSGEEGMRRLLATRLALDEAVEQWWTNGEHAPLPLLRDGLLALEAGHSLDETQRSFLLRTALRTKRGMVTALHYQTDPDRTAFLIKDALLDTQDPFDPALIEALYQQDEQGAEWLGDLVHDLAYETTVASGKRSVLAASALQIIRPLTIASSTPARPVTAVKSALPANDAPLPSSSARYPSLLTALARPIAPRRARAQGPALLRPLSHRWSLRWLFWAVLMLGLLLFYGPSQWGSATPMVKIPNGTYSISDPASSDPGDDLRFRTVTLAAYAIDRHEVTNAAYRRCWEQNACPIPSSFDSQLRPGYFANRAYDNFPVVNVAWEAANRYCLWVGKRLPTLEEWEVAASLAPATGLRYRYPWGDRFEPLLVNSALSDYKDTQAVGAYHPTGSTPLGIMDLAGNVAEWTSMPAASMVDGGVVKGGSYRDQPALLRNDALLELPRTTSAPWLGFRCAADE